MRGIRFENEKKWFITFGEKFIEAFGIESLIIWSSDEETAIGYLEQQFDLEIVFEEEYENGDLEGIFGEIEEIE